MEVDPVRIKTKTRIMEITTTIIITIKTVIGPTLTAPTVMDTTMEVVLLLPPLVVRPIVTDSFIICFIKILLEVAAAVVVPLPLLLTILLLRVVTDTILETLITKPDLITITTTAVTTITTTINITPTTMMTTQHPAPTPTLLQVVPPLPKTRMHSILVL